MLVPCGWLEKLLGGTPLFSQKFLRLLCALGNAGLELELYDTPSFDFCLGGIWSESCCCAFFLGVAIM